MRTRSRVARLLLLLIAIFLTAFAAAQGGSGPGTASASALEHSLAQQSPVEAARNAVIRIETEGAYRGTDGPQETVIGQGSGFIIHPSGIAVTNNHVVSGAGIIRVKVGFEDEIRNAVVLGASECSDLAVIDINGQGFPFLEWASGPLSFTENVWSAGFPLSVDTPRLASGSISALDADGVTAWTAIISAISHYAPINPGSSGGPLLNEEGKVIGVNFAADLAGITPENLAIPREVAIPAVERMRTGKNVTWIGVNSVALELPGISGIWVAAVEPGSPADEARIQAGDFIIAMGGIDPIVENGTKGQYCEVLNTNSGPGDVINIQVFRIDTGEILEGQINGRPLSPVVQPTPSPAPEPPLIPMPQPTATATPAPPPTSTPAPVETAPTQPSTDHQVVN